VALVSETGRSDVAIVNKSAKERELSVLLQACRLHIRLSAFGTESTISEKLWSSTGIADIVSTCTCRCRLHTR
jgi:hypothetical protein